MAVKITTDWATSAPTPSATSVSSGSIPSALPTTLSTPARRPYAIDRPITNRMLGPGMRMSSTAAIVKAPRLASGTMTRA